MKNTLIFLFCIVCLTPLRSCVILFIPIFVYIIIKALKLAIDKRILYVMTLIWAISSIWGLIGKLTSIQNVILSWYITFPLLLLFLCTNKSQHNLYRIKNAFIKYSTKILLFVNLVGFILGYFHNYYDDFMALSYGMHFARMNGLAMINIIYSFYYLNIYFTKKQKKELFLSIFFLISFFACSCGLAIVAFIITVFVIYLKKLTIKRIFPAFAICIVIFCIGNKILGSSLDYFKKSIEYSMNEDIIERDARKVYSFVLFYNLIKEKPIYAFTGVGPGGYNSRIAFLTNIDADNIITKISGHSMPKYHKQHSYQLWNLDFVSEENHTDGSRNKPFSSILSLNAEFGFLFGILFIFLYYRKIIKISRIQSAEANTIKFSLIFLLIMLLVDQWLETSEFLFIITFLCVLELTNKHQFIKNE